MQHSGERIDIILIAPHYTRVIKNVRVRFAPSPTGFLHVGGARTALYNWLFARHENGKFILRIEDTDRERSTEDATRAIIEGLRWVGLDWDEGPEVGGPYGPYFQSERLHIYKEHVEKLVASGTLYPCFCSPEELDRERKLQEAQKIAPRYGGKCKKLAAAEVEGKMSANSPHVLRFRCPMVGTTTFPDAIRGNVTFRNDLLEDFIAVKSDGFPTYNFAAVVDDHLMEISHVVRGDDHISNTPRQILLYQALGWTPPIYAHIPMILGADKTRLSKRHGATAVTAYEEMGYLPEAMVNYLVKLGWGYGDQEIFTRSELVEKFTLEKVGKVGAIFNLEKLNWLNGTYIRKFSPEELLPHVEPHLEKAYPAFRAMLDADRSHVLEILRQLQDRLRLFPDIVDLSEYFFSDQYRRDATAEEKYLKKPEVPAIVKAVRDRLDALPSFTKEEVEKVFKGLAAEQNVKLGEIIHPIRVLLTGRAESPPMYDVVVLLGKDEVLRRLGKIT